MIDSFLRQFPAGFADDRLIARELGYKRDAATLFSSCFGGSRERRLLARNEQARIADGLNHVYHFDLVYSSRPNWTTFERTQAFGAELLDRLGPHGAKDFIDVHRSSGWSPARRP